MTSFEMALKLGLVESLSSSNRRLSEVVCGQVWTGVGRCGQVWTGVDRRGQVWTGVGRRGQAWAGVERSDYNPDLTLTSP